MHVTQSKKTPVRTQTSFLQDNRSLSASRVEQPCRVMQALLLTRTLQEGDLNMTHRGTYFSILSWKLHILGHTHVNVTNVEML